MFEGINRKFIALLLFVGMALFGIWYVVTTNQIKEDLQATTKNARVLGMSRFHAFLEKNIPDRVRILREPLLWPDKLSDVGMIFIHHPTKSFTSREGKVLLDWVKEGGILWMSFMKKESYDMGTSIFIKEEMNPPDLVEDDSFKNQKTVHLMPDRDHWPFKKDHQYEFYSRYLFEQENCQVNILNCYFFSHNLGKGKVLLFNGLDPLSNSMVERMENRDVVHGLMGATNRMNLQGKNIIIDEFHHFFSDRTFWDLMKKPRFALPLLTMLALLFAWFRFGGGSQPELKPAKRKVSAGRSYLDLNRNLAHGILMDRKKADAALELYGDYLNWEFPGEKISGTAIPRSNLKMSELNREMSAMVQKHRGILKRKGILK